MKSTVVSVLLLSLAASTGAGSAQEVTAPQADVAAVTSIDVKPGDIWVYKATNEITGELLGTDTLVVTEKTNDVITMLVTRETSPENKTTKSEQFSTKWGVLQSGPWKYSKPDSTYGVELPLNANSKWQSKFDVSRSDANVTFRVTSHSSVVGTESMTLPSGEVHQTLKIEAESKGATATGRKSERKVTLWYDPAINRFFQVLTETRNNGLLAKKEKESLVSYSRKSSI